MEVKDKIEQNSTKLPLQHYVILVSDHNVAEYRACIELDPQSIYLVVTSKMGKPAERLKRQLEQQFSAECIHSLPSEDLDGENSHNIANWLNQHFLPITQRWQTTTGGVTAINMTGGTKLLSAMLTQAYDWDEVHYQAFSKSNAQIQRLKPQAGKLITLATHDIQRDISPFEAIRLYADQIHEGTPNPIRERNDSLAIALLRLQAQSPASDNDDIANPFGVLTPILAKIWYTEPPKSKTQLVAWQDFTLPRADMQAFLQRLDALNETPLLAYTEEGVVLPTRTNKQAQNWMRWISGDWFEQLVYCWLLESGIPENQIAIGYNIIRDTNNTKTSGETDIIVFHRQIVSLLELKADIDEGAKLATLEQQLTSQSQELGKVNKLLVVAPAIKNRHTAEQWQSFEHRCKERHVTLVVADSQQAIKNVIDR